MPWSAGTVIPFVTQASLFERGLTAGRSIEVEITGPDIGRLVALGQEVMGRTMKAIPDAQVRPVSDLELASPEIHLRAKLDLFVDQKLDILTMLGFVILVGTVVNNAILIVHQALNNVRDAEMPIREAITESVRTRVRPIFMSTLTSVFGMLPLVLFPGAGSELYRGLGSVVVGGLLVSTIFTLVLVPALFSLTWDARESLRRWWRGPAQPPSPSAEPVPAEPPAEVVADR